MVMHLSIADRLAAELRRRASNLALRGDYVGAAVLYERLIARTPSDAGAALRLAELRRRTGDVAGARAAYRLAMDLFLEAGWSEKAAGIEHALEWLENTPPPRGSWRMRLARWRRGRSG
jgi:predicted TPR repeat methyltransferase